MRKTLLVILVFLSLLVLTLRFGSEINNHVLGFNPKGGVKITSVPEATVFINDQEVGKTPFSEENLTPGEYKIKVGSESATWQGHVRVTKGTLSVINRDLASSVASSSGEILTLTIGRGVTVTSNPGSAEVEVDGKIIGRTPINITDLGMGDHTFILSREGYLKRSIRAYVPEGLMLNMAVDLAITEVNLTAIIAPPLSVSKEVEVTRTPTGFLRVRDKPSLSGKEIARLLTGETATLLEELGGWSKIRLATGKEGYASSTYLKKKS